MQGREEFWGPRAARRPARERRRARRIGLVGFVLAAAVPVALFHRVVEDIAAEFRLDVTYLLAEWTPWVLIVVGLLFALPVVWSTGRNPESRWYPRARNAYAGWAITLYLLGVALAVQVAQISGGLAP